MTPGNNKFARSHLFVFNSQGYMPISPQMPVFSQELRNPFPHFLPANCMRLILYKKRMPE